MHPRTVAVWLAPLASAAAHAACVEAADPTNRNIEIIRCADGVVIAAEADAARSSTAQIAAHPRVLQLDVGALAVAQATPDTFKILTPDAVVTARGGEWAVAVAAGRTQVAVRRGEATLTRRWDDQETPIRAGEAPEGQAFAPLHDALRRAAD